MGFPSYYDFVAADPPRIPDNFRYTFLNLKIEGVPLEVAVHYGVPKDCDLDQHIQDRLRELFLTESVAWLSQYPQEGTLEQRVEWREEVRRKIYEEIFAVAAERTDLGVPVMVTHIGVCHLGDVWRLRKETEAAEKERAEKERAEQELAEERAERDPVPV